MRWGLRIGMGLFSLIIIASATVYALTEQRLTRTFRVPVWKGKAASSRDAQAVARGEHLARTRGCLECHQKDGRGGLFIDAMPVMRLRPRNITPAGVTKTYSDADWERTVRHCVKPDGQPVQFMPCVDNQHLSDDDLAALIAFLRTLKPVQAEHEPSTLGPLGRVLFLAGELPYANAELIDHAAPRRPAPPAGPTAEYGKYLGDMCVGCHGEGMSGGPIPGVPPEWPEAANLTPDASGLGAWSEEQFARVLRTGLRPDGRQIDSAYMPWKQLSLFSNDEVHALWLHLHTLAKKPRGQR